MEPGGGEGQKRKQLSLLRLGTGEKNAKGSGQLPRHLVELEVGPKLPAPFLGLSFVNQMALQDKPFPLCLSLP